MYRIANLFCLLCFISIDSNCQVVDSISIIDISAPSKQVSQKTYRIKAKVDIPLTAAGIALSLRGMGIIYNRDSVPVAELNGLNKNNINNFDRSTTDNFDQKAKAASDKFFYGSMPLPLILLFDKKIRKDVGRVGILYLEAMGITGTLYTLSAMNANRFRPYSYNTNAPLSKRTRGGARNSFYAGHVAVVGTSTFFMTKVYIDYHPSMKNKWIFYTLAGAATTTTAILRVKAGEHFPTDAILGSILGPAVGFLVPHIHKNKLLDERLSIGPRISQYGNGFTAVYKF